MIATPDRLIDPASLLVAAIVLCHYCAWRTMAIRHRHADTGYCAVAEMIRDDPHMPSRISIQVSGPPRTLSQAAIRGCAMAGTLSLPVEWILETPPHGT
ncbi:MAG: hypothetical protein D6761_00785 [Candidatus Dadabacteria bacterium]|nr:MAG: hypothetical protein D6761_00785 [Candidatus Dadabacteria bacterium]